jgi:aminopeptidase N
VLELKQTEASFTFVGLAAKPVASVLRGFSAPVIVEYERPEDEFVFLMTNDMDPFNRWDAGQQYGTQLLLEGIAKFQAGESWDLPAPFVAALERTLDDPRLDRSLKAAALSLPGEGWLADRMQVSDPVAVHGVRQAARLQIARALRDKLLATYEDNPTPGAYEYNIKAVGRRSLANLCLAYLSLLADEETTALAAERFELANNMTDSVSALAALVDIPGPPREKALAGFYQKWRHEPLALDKWFSVQATCDLPDVTTQVEELLEHPDFTFKNPNRARALIGAYASGNPAAFHAADGSGYRFLARCVIEMDSINAQIASRLVDPMLAWRRLGPQRQSLLRAQLSKIAAREGLSKNVYEKVSKALA